VGLYIPTPFQPQDEFQLNLAREASRATLRVYDLGGDLVIALHKLESEKNYMFAWDGRNGSGTDVKKGPLVGVAEVVFEDGKKNIFREIFLFDPDN
jgi:flagellar hook assembly protein FlgD